MLLLLSLACSAPLASAGPLDGLLGWDEPQNATAAIELTARTEDSAAPELPNDLADSTPPEPTELPEASAPVVDLVPAPLPAHAYHVTALHNRVVALEWFLSDKASQKEGLTPAAWTMPAIGVYRGDPRSHAPNAAQIYTPEELASVPLPAPVPAESQMYELFAEALGVVSPIQ